MLGQDLFVLALLRGVTAMLFPHLVALPTFGRVAFALLIAASLPLLTLCCEFVSFALLLKLLLLSLVRWWSSHSCLANDFRFGTHDPHTRNRRPHAA